jgi:hypothetical protein
MGGPADDLRAGSQEGMPLAATRIMAGLALLALTGGTAVAADTVSGREVRCLAMVAYAEAAVDGQPGMTAVMRVVRNRMADPRFPRAACGVVGQDGQFQPMEERLALKRAVRAGGPLDLKRLLRADTPFERMLLRQALRLAAEPPAGGDPSGGALYFVNPRLMDPARCPWFAALRRTTRLGAHVFFAHYGAAERRRGPALDCRVAGRDNWMIARNAARAEGGKAKGLLLARAGAAAGGRRRAG